ncbi:hypothetical protein DL768_004038 [Monosporascus sp. mg162]|nr:hypothetical protein DL768_004038 [Monosporascus sp. mg162]
MLCCQKLEWSAEKANELFAGNGNRVQNEPADKHSIDYAAWIQPWSAEKVNELFAWQWQRVQNEPADKHSIDYAAWTRRWDKDRMLKVAREQCATAFDILDNGKIRDLAALESLPYNQSINGGVWYQAILKDTAAPPTPSRSSCHGSSRRARPNEFGRSQVPVTEMNRICPVEILENMRITRRLNEIRQQANAAFTTLHTGGEFDIAVLAYHSLLDWDDYKDFARVRIPVYGSGSIFRHRRTAQYMDRRSAKECRPTRRHHRRTSYAAYKLANQDIWSADVVIYDEAAYRKRYRCAFFVAVAKMPQLHYYRVRFGDMFDNYPAVQEGYTDIHIIYVYYALMSRRSRPGLDWSLLEHRVAQEVIVHRDFIQGIQEALDQGIAFP